MHTLLPTAPPWPSVLHHPLLYGCGSLGPPHWTTLRASQGQGHRAMHEEMGLQGGRATLFCWITCTSGAHGFGKPLVRSAVGAGVEVACPADKRIGGAGHGQGSGGGGRGGRDVLEEGGGG